MPGVVNCLKIEFEFCTEAICNSLLKVSCRHEGVMAPWCNPLTLQPEQSDGVGSISGWALTLECHDKGPKTQSVLTYFCDPSTWH